MSLRAIVAVFDHSQARLGDRLVLLALADYAHDDGRNAYPAIDTLAEKALVDRRTVQRSLVQLQELGEIEQTGTTPRGTKVWRIKLEGLGGDKLPPEGSSRGSSTRSGGNVPPRGDKAPPPAAPVPPLERWAAWSRANADATNTELLEYQLDNFHVPTAEWPALIEAHLQQTRRTR